MKLHKLVLALGLVFSGGMLLSGCSDGSSSASVPAEVPAISSKIKYQFVFVDSTTGTAITDPLNVTFTGAVALTAADGTAVTKDVATTTSDGFVAVGADFTSTNTEFSVLVGNRTLGWIETGTRVVGSADLTGEQVVTISLVNTNKAAAINSSSTPIAMAVADGTADATGKITATVVANTTPKTVTVTTVNDDGTTTETSTTVGTAALTVPANTVGKTADGTPASGALKVSSTYFSNADASSMDAFPGGFATSVNAGTATLSQLGGASSATGGSFVTGGFAQFNITDSSGKAIKNFDPPVEVGIDLPKGTKNADGTAELKVGDEYPVWSFDDATGSWKFEKMGTVAEKDPVDPKNFTVKFPTSHLSSWNLDFYVATCTGHLNLTGRNGDARPLTLQIQGTSGRTFSRTLYGVTDSAQTFLRYPMGTKVAVKVFDGSTLVGAATNLNLCSGGAVALSLPVIARGSLQINTYEACANGTRQRAVPAFVYAYSSKNGYSMGYTAKATSTSTVATKLVANQKVDTFTVAAYNPRTYRYEYKYNVPVTANNTTTVNYGWTMTCPSGGGN